MSTSSFSYYPGQNYLASRFQAFSLPEGAKPLAPPGFPCALQTPLAWTGEQIEQNINECILKLSTDDVDSLERAYSSFIASGNAVSTIGPNNFVLPNNLAARLRRISDNCYHGRGFTVVKGLDPSKYSQEVNVVLYAGLTSYVAPQRGFLDRDRTQVVAHITNAAATSSHEAVKNLPGLSNAALAFHTDNCEIMALYAMHMAPDGGQTFISSSYQLFNELAVLRPDILQTLSDHWVLDTFRDYSKYPPITRPCLHVAEEAKVMFTYSRLPMVGFRNNARSPNLPPLTEAQVEAMDMVQHLLTKNAIPVPWVKGDILFLNDMGIMHARSAFTDSQNGLHRHLVKLYLRDPAQAWPIPDTAREHWCKVYGPSNDRGGRDEQWCLKREQDCMSSGGGSGGGGEPKPTNPVPPMSNG